MRISIVIRSRNDRPFIEETMSRLITQQCDAEIELVNIDNSSSDGTWEVIRELNPDGITRQCPEGAYVPGKVLNQAVSLCTGEIVVFNNSDCIPQNEFFLKNLTAPLLSGEADIVFARQIPRPNARPLIRKDYDRAFGDGSVSAKWRHFFSLASSAALRELLLKEPFDETYQYSEDIEWSYRLKRLGKRILYVPNAIAEHSHNYNLRETKRRFFQEGLANSRIFHERMRFFRDFLLPFAAESKRDLVYLIHHASAVQWPGELLFRLVQRWSLYRGSLSGETRK